MEKIILLDDSMINKIAAGEVVERPGSVVKELVENSIDSGATRIIIEIQGGGIDMIRVSDNGSGIQESDVHSAFMRHATSKIRNMDDLEKVLTLGFRGEGLSSVAAVSQVEVITKTGDALMAKHVEIHGGKVVSDGFTAANRGTTLIVRNLFYNTPARRKFLKKPGTESGHVSDIVQRLVLAHPHISFTYIVNGVQSIITAENGSLRTAALAVYGREIAGNLIEVSGKSLGIEISGLIGKPEISRGNRAYGSIFINGRYIRSKLLESAIEEAYKNRLTVGKFPVYILSLKLNPALVDVNVHPQKLEVRFSDETAVYKAFYSAVSEGLRSEILIPEVKAPKPAEKRQERPEAKGFGASAAAVNFSEEYRAESRGNIYSVNMSSVLSSLFDKDSAENLSVNESGGESAYNYYELSPYEQNPAAEGSFVRPQKEEGIVQSNREEGFANTKNEPSIMSNASSNKTKPFFYNYIIIGQFLATYWMVQQGDAIYLIDQHAAHERVIFERLIKEYKKSAVASQRLVDPMILNLSDSEAAVLSENKSLFSRFGYDIEPMGADEFAIKAVPFILKGATSISLFTQILDKLTENHNSVTDIFGEKIEALASVACKAAVKANDALHAAEAKGLIEELLKLENPFNCPHGRPTILKLTKYEIEKMFKRIV